MPWREFWWIMCNDARARNEFLIGVALPLLGLLCLWGALIFGITHF
jgi:hypothetical protein